MATKRVYATGDFRYGTRMMRAGDPIDMAGPDVRLFNALGKISPNKPRAARPQLDHDADGTAGGSLKGVESTRTRGAARKRKTAAGA